jgi:integrase
MARPHKLWFRKSRNTWFVEIDAKQYNLGPDREEATTRFHELLAKRPTKASPNSVAAILDEFVVYVENHKTAATARWYKDYLQDFLTYLKDHAHSPISMPASGLRPLHVRKWLDDRSSERARLTAVKAAYRWAHAEGWIDANPIAAMRRPAETKREQLISLKEMKAILRRTKDRRFRELLIVSWDIGARPHELKILHDRHLDLDRHRAIIPAREAKVKKRNRVIYFTPRAERIIRRRRGDGIVFKNIDGKPWTASAIKCRFARLEKHLGVRFCHYAFRHSFATRKLKQGIPAIDVAHLLGHNDVSMLAKVYQHVEQDSDHLLAALNR